MDDDNGNGMAFNMTTAYTIAKEELPFTKFKPLIEMQRRNGVIIKDQYMNDVKCEEMISCINDSFKSRHRKWEKIIECITVLWLMQGKIFW